MGDIIFDFTDHQGETVDTIIIAGENGVGKSVLLNTIFDFSNYQLDNNRRDEKKIFEIELNENEINIITNRPNFQRHFPEPISSLFIVKFDYNKEGWEQIIIEAKTLDNKPLDVHSSLFSNNDTKRILKTIFSDAEINFTPKQILNVTSKNIDIETFSSEKSSFNIATEITQLLIDIQSLDALDFSEWGKNHIGEAVIEEKIDIRMKRFTSAFNYMFPSKKYKTVENKDNQKKIIFEEYGKEMEINQLSSGEKQIVFRGSFLLKDKESSKGAVILIDEPEISMHPTWQLKILNFFKRLFMDVNGQQTSQLIVVTHSPFIIHNANRSQDKVIVLQKTDDKISILDKPKFYSWSSEQIVHDAFNVSMILNPNNISVFLEGETDEKYFKKCIELFYNQELL
jgi:predicted ATPase